MPLGSDRSALRRARRAWLASLAVLTGLLGAAQPAAADETAGAASGLILYGGPGAAPLAVPVLDGDVRATVHGPVARVEAALRFRNPTDAWAAADLRLPLPADALVEGAGVHSHQPAALASREGEAVAPRPVGFGLASAARAPDEGESPAAWVRPVGEVPPHGTVTVRLTYVHRVPFDAGAFRLTLPAALFGAGPDGARLSEAPSTTGPVTLDIVVDAGFAVALVETSDAALTVERQADDRFRATLAGRPRSAGDLTLLWDPVPTDAPTVAVFTEVSQGTDVHLAMVMPPNDEDAMEGTAWYQQRPREILFIVDASPAMRGEPLRLARRLVHAAFDRLAPDDRLAVVAFGRQAHAAFPSARPADEPAIADAMEFIRHLAPGEGAGIDEALALATATPPDGRTVRQVVFIGRRGDAATVRASWGRDRRYGAARPYVMAVDGPRDSMAADRAFCGSVGAGGHDAPEPLQALPVDTCAADLFDARHMPVLTGIILRAPGAVHAELRPSSSRDLYLEGPVLLAARVPSGSAQAITVSASLAGRGWQSTAGPMGWRPAPGVAAFWDVLLSQGRDSGWAYDPSLTSGGPDLVSLAAAR